MGSNCLVFRLTGCDGGGWRMKLELLVLLLFHSAIGQTLVSDSIFGIFQNFFKNLIPRNPRKVLKDFPGCGKRYERKWNESKYGECLWDCEWEKNLAWDN